MLHIERRALFPLALVLGAAFTRPAAATPRVLPFTYQHEQLSAGEAEVEQFVDFTPVRAYSAQTGDKVFTTLTQFQTEFEIGILDRLELGLYFTYVPGPGSGFTDLPRGTEGTGLKQRLRYKFADTGEWPIDVSLYGELSENDHEVETELKVILQRRFGLARVIANVTGEREYYYDGKHDIVLAPSAGATFEVTPTFQPGIEWWMRSEFPEENPPSPRPFALGPHQYVGPVVLLQFEKIWWSTGVYVRASNFNHTMEPGDAFGAIWVRTMVGIGL
jgi:hypothetical protein